MTTESSYDCGFRAGVESGLHEVQRVRTRARRVAAHNCRLRRIVAFQAAVITVLGWRLVWGLLFG